MVLTFHKNTNNNQHTNHFRLDLGFLFFITKHFNMFFSTKREITLTRLIAKRYFSKSIVIVFMTF